jgi:uncharacterized delta-60 repeat protein
MGTLRRALRETIAIGMTILAVRLSPPALGSPTQRVAPSAGHTGTVTTPFKGGGRILALAIQGDHKIVAAGYSGRSSRDFALARYLPDGSLDPTFGTGGKVVTDFGGTDEASAVAILPTGRIVVAGTSGESIALARYMRNGTLDSSFGRGGKVTYLRVSVQIYAMAVMPHGKIVVAGYSSVSCCYYFELARFKPAGKIDRTFGFRGEVSGPFGSRGRTAIRSIAVEEDGRIVAAGYTGNHRSRFALARYQPRGAVDATFGSKYGVETNFGGSGSRAYGLAIDGDGRIVAVGSSNAQGSGGFEFALARYRTDGSLDPSFGEAGKVVTNFGSDKASGATAVAIQPNGRILAVGFAGSGGSRDFALARYRPNGTLDTTFGDHGEVLTNVGGSGSDDVANAIVLQANGKVVAGGSSDSLFAVDRYTHEGNLDVAFGQGGSGTNVSKDPAADPQVTGLSTDPSHLSVGHLAPGTRCSPGKDQTHTGSPT